jgi:hypothetical protein
LPDDNPCVVVIRWSGLPILRMVVQRAPIVSNN